MAAFRSLFVSHGSPMLAVENSAAAGFLQGLGSAMPAPRAVVVASAHWETDIASVTGAEQHRTIHDFGGFPRELYDIQYPARGDSDLAAEIVARLFAGGFDAQVDPHRGLDHGAWVPLRHIWPGAQVPVVALSLLRQGDASAHVRMGRTLAEFADEDILVLGSGGFVHNLGELSWRFRDALPEGWASEFADWLRECLTSGDLHEAVRWRERAPHAARAHPTPEHLMPLFVAWGAAGEGARGDSLHRTWQYSTLAMDAYSFV